MQQDANGHGSFPYSPYSGKIPTTQGLAHAVSAFPGLPPTVRTAAENSVASDGK